MSIELSFTRSGDGPPLIILHGLFGSNTNWRRIARALAKDFSVFSLDLRNHGDSPWHARMNYLCMADDVAQFITQHNISNPIILGHSMGGKTAMVLGLLHPTFAQKIIIADIAPVKYAHSHVELIHALLSLPLGSLQNRNDADRRLAIVISDAQTRGFLLQNLIETEGKFRWRINLDSIERNLNHLMDFPPFKSGVIYTKPTLVVHGQNSDYVKPEHLEEFYTLFPKSAFADISNAGHWLHAEQPQQFLRIVQNFLNPSIAKT